MTDPNRCPICDSLADRPSLSDRIERIACDPAGSGLLLGVFLISLCAFLVASLSR